MALPSGTRLGPYEVVAAIGAGGMGEVYRARDTLLNRDVALKVLPESFVDDVTRLARFEREAQLLASLNHPHIAQIYGLEQSGTVRALVMELVEGEDLARRIDRGRLSLKEALPIAKQIAEALEAAHEQGIVHRDLKPANVRVREDGTVKVLDFGLAKALAPDGSGASASPLSNSPTIALPAATEAGMILGTAAYMAPEQAAGRAADKRSDLWAFGVVLMEMLTGRQVFAGETMSEVLASVLKDEPDWTALPAGTPPVIRRLLQRCLEKDSRKRLDSAMVARLEIEEAAAAPTALNNAPATRRNGVAAILAALVVGATLSAVAMWVATRPTAAPPAEVARLTVTLPAGQVLAALASPDRDIAIAPDGRHLVYQEGTTGANARLVVRAIDQIEPVVLRSVSAARWPFFSPDGRWIGFFAQCTNQGCSALGKVAITGGAPIILCTLRGQPMGATWGSDDTIVFATNDTGTGLLSVSAGGGEPKVLSTPDTSHNEADHWFPSILPDGRTVLFTITPSGRTADNAQVAVLDLATGRTRALFRGGTQPQYVESGHLVYAIDGTLRAVRFDPVRAEVSGTPVPVLDDVMTKTNGTAEFSVSRHGTLVHVGGGRAAAPPRELVWVDRGGHEEPLNMPPRPYRSPRLSPDGTRIAVAIRDEQRDIWIWDLARKTLQRLTTDPGINESPLWTPDGKRVAFSAERGGVESVYWQAFDGTGTLERLSVGTQPQQPRGFSPDGTQIIFTTPLEQPFDLGVLALGPPRTSTLLWHSPTSETNPEISPDGKWLAYQSDESGRQEVYVRSFPNVDVARHQISTAGGTRPVWSRTGHELFYYVAPGTIMAVPVSFGTDVTLGGPHLVVDGRFTTADTTGRQYDVTADGKRFLVMKDAPAPDKAPAPEIHIILNWFEELKATSRPQ